MRPYLPGGHWILAVCIVLIAWAAPAAAEDRITTRSGEQYIGTIKETSVEQLTIETSEGALIVVPRSQIRSIEFNVDPLSESPSASPHFDFLGVTLLTPAGLNLVYGHWFGDFGLRFSGAYFGGLAGLEIDALHRLSINENVNHSLFWALGSLVVDNNNWNYLGFGWLMNLSGFFVQAGLSIGAGDYSSPQLIAQIGYVYEFR